jgi:hypothetical protein
MIPVDNKIRTAGEIAFESYLASAAIPFEFEREHAGKSKRPDYTIEWNGQTIVLDVKDFAPAKTFSFGAQAFDPYIRIREKIEQGRDKFTQFKEYCCGLVLYNAGHPFAMLDQDYVMLGSMYGDSGFTFPMNTITGAGDARQMKPAFLDRGKMLRPNRSTPQNTTISALITLDLIRPHYLRLLDMVHEYPDMSITEIQEQATRVIPEYEPDHEVPRVIVWHNGVARIPFPEELFRGPYDTHFGIVSEADGVYQRVTYRGSLLPSRLSV